jgi:hypothetical protein
MGRAFAVMMSQGWFSNAIRHAPSKAAVLKCVDHFLDRTVVIPKLTETDVAEFRTGMDLSYEESTMAQRVLSCFGRRERQHLSISCKLHI